MENKQEGDKDQDRKGKLEMDGVAPTLPVVGGEGRRSRKLRDHPPGDPTEDGGASGRKRARRQEGEADVLKTADAGDDGVNVSVQVKVNHRRRAKVTPSSDGANGLDWDESSEAQLKVEGVKGGREASSLSIIAGGEEDTNDEGASRRSEMGSSEGAPEEEAHPCLFIENVLDVVFKHIINQPGTRKDVAKDVQSIRLVCKTWKASVTRAYRRTGLVAKFGRYDYSQFHYAEDWGTVLIDFMEMMNDCEMIPVQKFKFGGWSFYNGNLDLFGDFFRICGPEVVSLEIHLSSAETGKLFRTLANLPELNLPKLKTLEVQTRFHKCYRSRAKERPGILSLIELLLTAATSLQKFGLSYPPPSRSGFTHPKPQVAVMQQLGQTIARTIPGTLKQLTLRMEVTEPTFGKLAEAGLKLERFEFDVPSPSKWGSRTLFNFLQSQAPTLNALRISSPRPKLNSRIRMDLIVELPVLGKLVELTLSDVIISTTNTTTRPFDLAKSFPKLHRLELPGMTRENAFRTLLSNGKEPTESLKILHLPVWERASLAPFVMTVGQSFPSITELHLVLHKEANETLEDVFLHFDNLESLHLTLSQRIPNANWVESMFSGTSERDCAMIKRTKDFGTVNLYVHQVHPSIHYLTRLRKLVVNGNGCNIVHGRSHIPFTDFSAHFIFLEMDNLREIELSARDVAFSPRYLDLLRDKLVLWE